LSEDSDIRARLKKVVETLEDLGKQVSPLLIRISHLRAEAAELQQKLSTLEHEHEETGPVRQA
jgi:predicted  nucleic acid-binding Zn-ribbon protein